MQAFDDIITLEVDSCTEDFVTDEDEDDSLVQNAI